MARKDRTKVPRPPTRKRKASARPVPPRPKGEEERTAVRRLAAMKYRIAGATYRVIAEKLTEERAQAYAGEKSISAMTRIKHVSTKTAWDDVTAEMEDLQADGTTRVVPSGTRLTLPSGQTGPILRISEGLADPSNADGGGFLTEVLLG